MEEYTCGAACRNGRARTHTGNEEKAVKGCERAAERQGGKERDGAAERVVEEETWKEDDKKKRRRKNAHAP